SQTTFRISRTERPREWAVRSWHGSAPGVDRPPSSIADQTILWVERQAAELAVARRCGVDRIGRSCTGPEATSEEAQLSSIGKAQTSHGCLRHTMIVRRTLSSVIVYI